MSEEGGKSEAFQEFTGDSEQDGLMGSYVGLPRVEEEGEESCNGRYKHVDDKDDEEVGDRDHNNRKEEVKKKKKLKEKEEEEENKELVMRKDAIDLVEEMEMNRLFWETCLRSGYP